MTLRRSIIHVLLAASVAANAALADKVLRLDRAIASAEARPSLEHGAKAPDLVLHEASGTAVNIRYSESQLPTVLYVISPTCNWCTRNRQPATALSAALANRARFVGVLIGAPTRDSLFRFLSTEAMPFPIYTGLSDEDGRRLRLRSTPTTIVVSNAAAVLAVWEGAYAGSVKAGIEQYFDLTLPAIGPGQ